MSVEDLNQLIHLLATYKPGFDLCDIFISPDFQEVLLKRKVHSKSDTQVLFGTFMNLANANINADVSMKIWFGWNKLSEKDLKDFELIKPDIPLQMVKEIEMKFDPENLARLKALEYETAVYRYLTDTFITTNFSPNFIPILAFGSCPVSKIKENIFRVAKPNEVEILKSFFELADLFPNLDLNILVTGTTKQGIVHLENFIQAHPVLPKYEIKSIIFQLVYTLYLLEQVRVVHNDLHFDNILIQTLTQPVTLTYVISPGLNVSFMTQYVIRFFDWDRSYVSALGENPILNLDWNIELNTLNEWVPNRDFYQIVCLLKHSPKAYRRAIDDILPNPGYNKWQYDGEQNVIGLNPKQEALLKDKKFKRLSNGLKIIFLNKAELVDLLETMDEVDTYIGLDRFENSDEFIVKFDEDGKLLFFPGGWGCQPLYKPSKSLLYALPELFLKPELLAKLTQGLRI